MKLLEKIMNWGSETPDKVAHTTGAQNSRIHYGELCLSALKVGEYLERTSGSMRSPVIVYGHKEPEMLIAFLGAVLSGRPYVPVDISIPRERVLRIKDSLRDPVVLTPETVRKVTAESKSPGFTPIPLESGDPFYIMFTSGSTGEPKGVIITRECLEDFAGWMMEEQQFATGNEVFLNQAPFSFDLSVMDLYLSLASGGTLFSITRDYIASPAQLFRALRISATTVWVSTPSFAALCIREPSFSAEMLPDLNRFLFCGEVLPADLSAELLKRFPRARLWNTYGPTEATVATTSIEITGEVISSCPRLPVGYAKPRTRILIMNEAGGIVPEGDKGEIVIAGPNVAAGYLNRPDLTGRSFFELDGMRAYRTGDAGFCRGNLIFCDGRMDSQIKLHGYRIELGDIEANLKALESVRDAVVVPHVKDGRVEFLSAFVIAEKKDIAGEDDFASVRKLKKALGERVPSYMVPQQISFVLSFPITANGKIDRKSLTGG